jgi:hypothetical protein
MTMFAENMPFFQDKQFAHWARDLIQETVKLEVRKLLCGSEIMRKQAPDTQVSMILIFLFC